MMSSRQKRVFVLAALLLLPSFFVFGEDPPSEKKGQAKIAELEWTRDMAVKAFLSDDDSANRLAAARALGRIAAPGDEIAAAESETIQMLLSARLKEEREPPVRQMLITGLGFAGTPRAARELIKLRDDGEGVESLLAARALRLAVSEDDRADLVRGLSLEPAIRDESALALGVLERKLRAAKIATIDTATRTALLEALAKKITLMHGGPHPPAPHGPPYDHFPLVYALAALGDTRPDARAALARVLGGSDDPEARAEAARGLTRGVKAETPVPDELLADYAEPAVAVEVVHALARHTASKPARERLRELAVKHASFHARRDAIAALGTDAGAVGAALREAEIAVIEKALADPSMTVRANALVALASRAPEKGLAAVKELLSKGERDPRAIKNVGPNVAERMACARALGVLLPHAKEASLDLSQLAAHDDDHRVRMAALGALGEHGDDAAAVGLATNRVEHDTNPGVFETAVEILLEKGGPEAEAALLAGYERLRENHDFVEARETLVTALGKRGDKLTAAGKKLLERAASDPEGPVVAAANGARGGKAAPRARKVPPVNVVPLGSKRALLTITTSRGVFEVELLNAVAPLHVANVIALAEKKLYDGLTWHRVVSNFVIQGGCPRGDGSGDAGYNIPDELSLEPYSRGTLGMPKSATKDTGGCQLFFMHGRAPHLEGRYTVFGRIRKGVDVVDLIEEGDTIESVKVSYFVPRRVS